MATVPPPPKPDASELQALIGPLWRRKWLVLAIVIVSTVGTYVSVSKQAPQYRSSTQFIVSSTQIEAIVNGAASGGDDRTILDQAKLLLSAAVADRVAKRFAAEGKPQYAQGSVSAVPVETSSFIAVTTESASSEGAAELANAYVDEYFKLRNEQVKTEADAAIARVRAQLATVPAGLTNSQTRTNLQATIRQLQAAETATPLQAQQTNPATAGAQFAPTPKKDAVFAFVIALALGLALALALERFDRRMRTIDDVAGAYGAPLLSIIPHTSSPVDHHDGKAIVPDALREPFRALRTNLQLASLDRPIKRIVVTSAIAGEGKSTIVRNLALTYREWGQSVVVLEADLRRPTLSAALGVPTGTPGLTAVLTGDCELHEALQEVDFDIASLEYLDKIRVGRVDLLAAGTKTSATSSRLMLLPSGATPPNPQAVIGAEATRRIIHQLSEWFDIVLIDTPPLLAVSDAMSLLPQADGVVLVARVGVTQRAAAQRAAATARVDPSVRVLGVVANDLDYQPGSGYGYGYGYGSGYGPSSNGKKT